MNLSKNVGLCSLPPCRKALVQHIHRVNYQMGIWRRANTPIIEVPRPTDGHGWTVNDVGQMMPVWYEGECLPNILVDDESFLDVDESDDEYEDDEPALDDSDSDDDY